MSSDLAIVGFGFGGLMVLANTVRAATGPLNITVIASDARGVGLAYGTDNPLHLLNVPAQNMSAFAQEPAHFLHWLRTPEAAALLPELGLASLPGEGDFSPRVLYGRYLGHILHATMATAAQKHIAIDWVEASATTMAPSGQGWRIEAGERHIEAARVVIATGNEAKSMFPHLPHDAIIEQPWRMTKEQVHRFGSRPIVLIGTGLTSVDILLSLRRWGYHGVVHAISRNGLLPLPHKPTTAAFALDTTALFACKNLLALLRFVRAAIHDHERVGGDWRAVIDALRPHAIALWQQMTPRDQRAFIRRLATQWNSHRHRMAPSIAAIMAQEIATGKLHMGGSHHLHATADGEHLKLAVHWMSGAQEVLQPAAILNCAGPEINWARSTQTLLQGLLRDGHVTAHATGLGVVADAHYKIGTNLYAIGTPMTGQFWESTAVPELRQQAASLGETLCR